MLNDAKELRDLAAALGNRLEPLHKEREGQHSIRISDQWRVCFVWRDGDAYEVEITIYGKVMRTFAGACPCST